MRCNKVNRLLSRYVDKELPGQRVVARIEAHLKACPACQAQLEALVATKGLLRQKQAIAAPEGFLERLQERLGLQSEIIKVRWLPEAGNLARRLIPVPVVVMLLMLALIFGGFNGANPVDEYIYSDLSDEEIGILGGYIDNSTLLAKAIFE